MKKSELIDAIAAKAGITKADARRALDAFIETTKETMKKGNNLPIVGFGTFSVVKRPARKGINPSTKKPISIPAKNVCKFKPGSELKAAVKK